MNPNTTRISRYQDSISRFIKSKSIISDYDDNQKNIFIEFLSENDFMLSILVSTFLLSLNRKSEITGHTYYSACLSEMLIMLIRLVEKKNYYIEKYTQKKYNIVKNKIITSVNIFLSQSIDNIKNHHDKDKLLKNYIGMSKNFNVKLSEILDEDYNFELEDNITRSDLMNYEYYKEAKQVKTKLKTLKRVKKESMLKYVENKYGSICNIILQNMWFLGNGDDKLKKYVERFGQNIAIMLKIYYDWKHLESDILNSTNYCNNVIVNLGIQESFELFINAKQKVLENCMLFNLYTITTKEVIDFIEEGIDIYIDKLKPDLRSQYTLSTDSS